MFFIIIINLLGMSFFNMNNIDEKELLKLGNHHYEQRNLDSAFYYFNEVVELYPESDEGYFKRAKVLEKINDLPGAVNDYSIAIEINPIPKYYNNRGVAQMLMQEFEKAKRDFLSALQLEKSNMNTLANLGYVYHYLGQSEDACATLKIVYDNGDNSVGQYLNTYCN